jgi:hypothetical protein
MNTGLVGCNTVLLGEYFKDYAPFVFRVWKSGGKLTATISSLTVLLGLFDSFEHWTDRFTQNFTD